MLTLPFVNRVEEIGFLTKALLGIHSGTHQIVSVAGISGQGKSALQGELLRRALDDPRLAHIRTGKVDLSDAASITPIFLLIRIRNALAKTSGMSFPAFESAFQLFWEEASPNQALPAMEYRWLDIAGELIGEGGGEALQFGAEVARQFHGLVAPAIGLLTVLLKRLGGFGIKKAYRSILQSAIPSLSLLFDENRRLRPVREIEDLLPRMLADDIGRWHKNHPDDRVAIILDEYERVLEFGGASGHLRDRGFDSLARTLCAICPATLFIVFGRETLKWHIADPLEWRHLPRRELNLRGLKQEHAHTALHLAGVNDDFLRETMIHNALEDKIGDSATQTYPMMLALQAELHRRYIELGKNPVPEHFALSHQAFEGRRNELIARLLRSYSPAIEATLKRLSVARRFNKEVFRHIVFTFGTALPIDEWSNIKLLSLISPYSPSEVYRISHATISEGLQLLLGHDECVTTHAALADYYISLCRNVRTPGLSSTELWNTHDAFYHLSNSDPAKALDWWAEEGATHYREHGVGRAIETIDLSAFHIAGEHFAGSERFVRAVEGLADNLRAQRRFSEAEFLAKGLAKDLYEAGAPPEQLAKCLLVVSYDLRQQGMFDEECTYLSSAYSVLAERSRPPDDTFVATCIALGKN